MEIEKEEDVNPIGWLLNPHRKPHEMTGNNIVQVNVHQGYLLNDISDSHQKPQRDDTDSKTLGRPKTVYRTVYKGIYFIKNNINTVCDSELSRTREKTSRRNSNLMLFDGGWNVSRDARFSTVRIINCQLSE